MEDTGHWSRVWNGRSLEADVLFTKFPLEVDTSDIQVKVDAYGWIWRPTIPTGRLTLFFIIPVVTIIEGLKSTFNVRDTAEDKTTRQKVLFT